MRNQYLNGGHVFPGNCTQRLSIGSSAVAMSYIYTKEPPTNGKVSMRAETAVPVALRMPFCKAFVILNKAHLMVSVYLGSRHWGTSTWSYGAKRRL